jgi:hypothetical protein
MPHCAARRSRAGGRARGALHYSHFLIIVNV